MSVFHLVFVTKGGRKRPPLAFEGTFNAVFNTAKTAVEDGYYEHEDTIIQLGEETVVHLLSAEALAMMEQAGLVVDEWNLVIELTNGTVLPPIPYSSKEDVEHAVKAALRGWAGSSRSPRLAVPEPLCRVKTPEHEAIWFVPAPGTTYHVLNKEACIERVTNPNATPSRGSLIM